jgi:anti-sigma factor RsiW
MTHEDETSRDLLLNALLDGELDAKGALEVERQIAHDPATAAQYARMVALRNVLSTHMRREEAPEALRRRIAALVETQEKPAARKRDWRGYGSAIAATALLTLGLQHLAEVTTAPDARIEAIVFAHMRGQISGQPTDVASSDRHTVKPWLAGKLPVATIVVDLASEGFPLIGGRVDIVEGAAAPTLVYKRREHLISVTELGAANRDFGKEPRMRTLDGYPVVAWTMGDRSFVAVSDLAPAELLSFAELLRAAAGKELPNAGAARHP